MGEIMLSFDVEEFDIPLEYGFHINPDEQISVTTGGLKKVISLLDKHGIRATFFVTAVYAQKNPGLVTLISGKHEIASHGFSHSVFSDGDLLKSKIILEDIIKKKIYGFRMPRLAEVSDEDLLRAGYEYNSSLNPTILPGRYNNLGKPRLPYLSGKLLNIPVSVTPVFRIPLFWLSCKNLNLNFLFFLMKKNLKKDKILSLYFHPWEFENISGYKLPAYISKPHSTAMLARMEEIIVFLEKENKFIRMNDFKKNFFENSF